jgi:rare lipoprotein A
MKLLVIAVMALLLGACANNSSIFSEKDSAPGVVLDPATIKDAVPRKELITRAGNKSPYTVLGKTYRLLPSSDGYLARGTGSWYGTKFHGRPTANGERYSLYEMTAAHKTLPIPSFVKVTNLENGRTAIVRINDRGPFHEGRIIDLSYAAAVKLGYAAEGTALVEVEAINLDQRPPQVKPPIALIEQDNSRYFIQVGAFKSLLSAQSLRAELSLLTTEVIKVTANQQQGDFYRVRIGPLALKDVQGLMNTLKQEKMGNPKIISE